MGKPTSTPAALHFARVARALSGEARRLGLEAPGFRSPPRLPGSDRTIRRARWGAVVSVRLRGRSIDSVATDMVEGVIRANSLEGDAAQAARTALLGAVSGAGADPATPMPAPPRVADAA